MKRAAPLLLALVAIRASAATAYVSDELVLGVYADTSNQAQKLATLHSGSSVETLGVEGDFTQVRLGDGVTGWVKTSYLTGKEPAVVRLKHLEEELDRSHATPPGQAEAAARNELEQLHRSLDDTQHELDALRTRGAIRPAATPESAPVAAVGWLGWALALLGGGGLGFWLGYATLARRVRERFGGIKVY